MADETGRVLYFNQAVTRLLGLQHQSAEGQPITRYLPELDWRKQDRARPRVAIAFCSRRLEFPNVTR